jgi:hypothetical protein
VLTTLGLAVEDAARTWLVCGLFAGVSLSGSV